MTEKEQELAYLPMAVSLPVAVPCRLLQNSYTTEAQIYQNVTVKARPKPPINQCKFTEEQVYAQARGRALIGCKGAGLPRSHSGRVHQAVSFTAGHYARPQGWDL
jgi:hypothetical protein